MKTRLNSLKKTIQYIMLFVKENKEYMHDGIDEEIFDLLSTAIKEIDEIKREV